MFWIHQRTNTAGQTTTIKSAEMGNAESKMRETCSPTSKSCRSPKLVGILKMVFWMICRGWVWTPTRVRNPGVPVLAGMGFTSKTQTIPGSHGEYLRKSSPVSEEKQSLNCSQHIFHNNGFLFRREDLARVLSQGWAGNPFHASLLQPHWQNWNDLSNKMNKVILAYITQSIK